MQGYPQDIAIPSANLVSNQCAIDIQNKFLRGCTDVTIDREALVFIQGRKVVNRGGARATVQNPRSQSLVSPNLFDVAPADQFHRLLCAMPDWAKTGGIFCVGSQCFGKAPIHAYIESGSINCHCGCWQATKMGARRVTGGQQKNRNQYAHESCFAPDG